MSKPTLVLLPGLASDEQMWHEQRLALSSLPSVASVQVSTVHARLDSIEAMAQALLTQYPGPLILCGASMGGIVAMEAARLAPSSLHALLLLGTNARPETPDIRALREQAIVLFEQNRLDEVLVPNIPLAFHAPTDALRRDYLAMIHRAGASQLIRQNRAIMERPDARPHLPNVDCPTLVLCGENDQLTPLECSREIASLIPKASLQVLPDCGHMLTMEKPCEVTARLLGFLQSQPQRA